jgi:hypothetical protein
MKLWLNVTTDPTPRSVHASDVEKLPTLFVMFTVGQPAPLV